MKTNVIDLKSRPDLFGLQVHRSISVYQLAHLICVSGLKSRVNDWTAGQIAERYLDVHYNTDFHAEDHPEFITALAARLQEKINVQVPNDAQDAQACHD